MGFPERAAPVSTVTAIGPNGRIETVSFPVHNNRTLTAGFGSYS